MEELSDNFGVILHHSRNSLLLLGGDCIMVRIASFNSGSIDPKSNLPLVDALRDIVSVFLLFAMGGTCG